MTDSYGLFGHPVKHSWSPFIHGMFARQTDQDMVYRLYDSPPERFRSEVLEFFADGGLGLNVTLPHKQAAADLVNELTPRAQQANAVNTIVRDDLTLIGDNTDGTGLVIDLKINLKLEWTRPHRAIRYNIYRGDLASIRAAGGVRTSTVMPALSCGVTTDADADGLPDTIDASMPLQGKCFGYLVSARNATGEGPLEPAGASYRNDAQCP